jgi:hypothetical protein
VAQVSTGPELKFQYPKKKKKKKKKNDIMSFARRWLKLEIIMLSEKSRI